MLYARCACARMKEEEENRETLQVVCAYERERGRAGHVKRMRPRDRRGEDVPVDVTSLSVGV